MKSASDEQIQTAQDEAIDRRRLLQSGRIRLVPERLKKETEQSSEKDLAQKQQTSD